MIFQAVQALRPNSSFEVRNNILVWKESSKEKPTEEEIQAKIEELQAAEPLRQLRIQRNQLLQQTDWRMTTDYPYSDQESWASYRTALRDLPATAEPTLDEQGNLIVNWPTAPDNV